MDVDGELEDEAVGDLDDDDDDDDDRDHDGGGGLNYDYTPAWSFQGVKTSPDHHGVGVGGGGGGDHNVFPTEEFDEGDDPAAADDARDDNDNASIKVASTAAGSVDRDRMDDFGDEPGTTQRLEFGTPPMEARGLGGGGDEDVALFGAGVEEEGDVKEIRHDEADE